MSSPPAPLRITGSVGARVLTAPISSVSSLEGSPFAGGVPDVWVTLNYIKPFL